MKIYTTCLISFLILIKFNDCLKICEKSPKWTLNGKTFPNNFNSNVKLVAFLKASCNFCRKQAENLGLLDEELKAENKNVSILIVNSFDQDCINRTHVFKELTKLPVLQDIQKINVWSMNNASIDDMIIFDKNNRMIKHLSMPESFVHSGSVKNAILDAYNNDICSKKRPNKIKNNKP